MVKLLSAEWLRIRRYWLTWLLAGLWIFVLTLQVNHKLGRLAELKDKLGLQPQPQPDETTPLALALQSESLELAMLQENLQYPAFIGYTASLATAPGWFLVILFTAVLGGEDFTRRTLHSLLARGVGRSAYLLARSLALWLAAGAGVALMAALAAVVGLVIHGQVTSEPITFQGLGSALLYVLRAWLSYLPFIAAVLVWAVLGRNAGPGMGIGLGLHFLEYLVSFVLPFMAVTILSGGNLPAIYHWVLWMWRFSLGYNADVLLNWGSPFLIDLGKNTLLPVDPWRSATLLAAYICIFLSLALWSLRRQEIAYSG